MQDIVYKDGFDYGFDSSACASCGGACCTGESGVIDVNKHEMERIASFLEMEVEAFKNKYLYKVGYRYSLKENEVDGEYECVFFDRQSGGCKVYPARPLQCRTFPFWEYFKTHKEELKNECPGIVDGTI